MALGIRGLVVAAFTPMKADGSLDLDRVGPLVDHHERTGIAGLYVTGSTGEGVSLTAAERRDTVAAFASAARGRLPVIVQVGHNSLRESRALAEHAESAGAAAISAISPSYFRPDSVETLVESLAEITAGAPGLPFYYYHIPILTRVEVRVRDLLAAAGDRIPTFAGAKFTSPDLNELQACLELDGGRYEIFSGRDELLLGALAHGARAAVGSTYNLAAPLYRRLIAAFERGDIESARAEQSRSIALVDVLLRHGIIPAQKAAMALIGVDVGPTRLPIRAITGDALDALRRELEAIGFFEWALE